MNWLTATEVKTTLDQRRRKPMMQGAGRTSVAALRERDMSSPADAVRLNDLRLGRAFFRRRCGTQASEIRGVKFDRCGEAKQALHRCRPDPPSGNGCCVEPIIPYSSEYV
jgi:hypothetical protein